MSSLNHAESTAWQGFLRAHKLIMAHLDAELLLHHHLPLVRYEALAHLHRAGRALRMHELADRLVLSRSAATRFVDRLERDGLVRRRLSSTDRRGMEVELTPTGLARLVESSPTHDAGIRRHFLDNLEPDQLKLLGEVLARMIEAEED